MLATILAVFPHPGNEEQVRRGRERPWIVGSSLL